MENFDFRFRQISIKIDKEKIKPLDVFFSTKREQKRVMSFKRAD
jgi:hypothetical protein